MSLKIKAIRGAFWFALATATANLLSFLVTLILARLLTPDDFGLLAIASFVVSAMAILQNMGLSQALIYRKDDLNEAADTTFFLAIGLGLMAFLFAILGAPFVAVLFNEPRATPLAQILAISLIISSLGLVPEAIIVARLEFRQKFVADVIPSLGYAFVAIGLAVKGMGIWSIVVGRVFELISRVGFTWYLAQWRPYVQFKWPMAKEVLTYGKDIALSSTLAVFFLNIDNVFISRMLDTAQLGYYTFAFSLATLPVLFAQRVIDTVSFPTYTQIREQQQTLVNAYLKSLRIITMLVLPTNLGLLAIAPVVVPVLYGDKWRPSIILIQILSLYGLIRAIANAPTTVLLAIGKQYFFPRVTFFYFSLAVLVLGPAIYLVGTVGAAIAMTVLIWAAAMTWILFANYYLTISFQKVIQTIIPQGLASIFMVVIVQLGMYFLSESLYTLIFLVGLGSITYIIILIALTKGKAIDEAKEIIRPLISRGHG